MFKSKSWDSFIADFQNSPRNSATPFQFNPISSFAKLSPSTIFELENTIRLLREELVEVQGICDELVKENDDQRQQIANLNAEMAEMSDQIQSQDREDSVLLRQELARLKKLQVVMQQKLKKSEVRNERAEKDRSRLELKLTKLISKMTQITHNVPETEAQKVPEVKIDVFEADQKAFEYDSSTESESLTEGDFELGSTPKAVRSIS